MQQADIILALRNAIRDDKALVNVIRALKSDNIIWNALEDSAFLDACIQKGQENPYFWKPCNIALLAVEKTFPNESIKPNSSILSSVVRESALQSLNDICNWQKNNPALFQVSLIALLFRNKFDESTCEDELLTSDFQLSNISGMGLSTGLQTLFAILYGFVSDEGSFFQKIITLFQKHMMVEILTHVILTQPLHQADQLEVLYRVTDLLPLAEKVGLVSSLQNHGLNTLSLDLGNHCFSQISGKNQESFENKREIDLVKIRDMESLADLLQLIGQDQKSAELFEKAQEEMQKWNKILSVKKDQGSNKDEYLVSDNPFDLAIQSVITLPESEISQIQANALKIIELFISDFDGNLPSKYHARIFKSIERLIDIGLWKESSEIFNHVQIFLPVGKEVARLGYLLNDRIENFQAALDFLGILVTLDPDDFEIRRKFAILMEKNGRVDDAYQEWNSIINGSNSMSSDFEKTAKLAIELGDFQNAFVLGKKLIELTPMNGFGLGVIGYSQFKLGHKQEALEFINRSLDLDSDNPQTWLWRAEIAVDLSGYAEAEKFLLKALQYLPNNPDLNYQLAKIMIDREAYTEALPFVRRAAEFLPDSLAATQDLLGILETLGLLGEELQLLHRAVNRWPNDPKLAHINGRQLLNLGKYAEALPYLEFVLANSQSTDAIYLELSKAIIDGRSDSFVPSSIDPDLFSKAKTGIKKYLETSPNFEGRYYQAGLLMMDGRFDSALSIFKELIQLPDANNDAWKAKIQTGIGEIALQNEQFETALISLKEALECLPDSIRARMLLVEVYTKLNFSEDAERCAEKLYMDHQNDIAASTWFAGLLQKVNQYERAAIVYENALAIQPQHSDLLLKLADCYRACDEFQRCKDTLAVFLKMEKVDPSEKKEAAVIANVINDDKLAIELLASAQCASKVNDPDLAVSLSHLYLKNANFNEAREALGNCLESNAENGILLWKLSETEELLGNHGKAIELLDKLLKCILKSNEEISIPSTWTSAKILPEGQAQFKLTTSIVNTKIGNIHYKLEENKEALTYYVHAAESDPKNIFTLHRVIELDDRLLSGEKLPVSKLNELVADNEEEERQLAEIYAIMAHHAMDDGNYDGAKVFTESALKLSDQNPFVRSARIRGLVENEKENSANDEYQALKVTLDANLWIPIAAAEVGNWTDAIERSREYVRIAPFEARGWLHLAKVLVIFKENSEFLHLIRSEASKYSICNDSNEMKKEFESAIIHSESLSSNPQIQYWKNRGKAIFEISVSNSFFSEESIKTPEEAVHKTLVLIESDNIDDALETTFLFPKFPKLMVLRALCLFEKNPTESLKFTEEALRTHSTNPYVLVGSAIINEKMGNQPKSKESLKSALQYRDDANWDCWYSEICINLGDLDGAIASLSHAFMIENENINIAFRLSELYLQMGLPELAIATWEKYPLNIDKNVEIQQQLAKAYAAMGEIGKISTCLEKAITETDEQSKILIFASELMHECGDLQQAFDYARQALNSDPRNSQAWIQLSRVMSQKTNLFEGLQILLKAEQKNVNDPTIHYEKARLTRLLYGENKALPLFEKTFNENPDYVEVIVELAEIYYKLGFLVKANEMADLAIKAGYENWFIHYLTGLNAANEGQLDLAMKHLNESIKMNPVYLGSYITLINILQKRREFSLAIQVCKTAIENLPTEKEPYLIVIQLLRDGKDYAGAEEILRKLLEINPEDVALKRQLGALIALNMVVNA